FRLPMLSTPPHGDAVTVGYRIKPEPPDEDLHLADSTNLQTHWGTLPASTFNAPHREEVPVGPARR
ncbi:MAG: hypothetical protein ACKV0T_20020, partial [Planctomycetales bacterium]